MKLYHRVPVDMTGDVLYPLNVLKDKHPELFTRQCEKYVGRESTMKREIPGLGLWNDVLHLSPIHPAKILAARMEAGIPIDWSWKVYVIDPEDLDWTKLKLMRYRLEGGGLVKDYLEFNEETYKSNSSLTEYTLQLYRESAAKGELPFHFMGSPHVLYAGEIDVSSIQPIEFNREVKGQL